MVVVSFLGVVHLVTSGGGCVVRFYSRGEDSAECTPYISSKFVALVMVLRSLEEFNNFRPLFARRLNGEHRRGRRLCGDPRGWLK